MALISPAAFVASGLKALLTELEEHLQTQHHIALRRRSDGATDYFLVPCTQDNMDPGILTEQEATRFPIAGNTYLSRDAPDNINDVLVMDVQFEARTLRYLRVDYRRGWFGLRKEGKQHSVLCSFNEAVTRLKAYADDELDRLQRETQSDEEAMENAVYLPRTPF